MSVEAVLEADIGEGGGGAVREGEMPCISVRGAGVSSPMDWRAESSTLRPELDTDGEVARARPKATRGRRWHCRRATLSMGWRKE